MPLGFISLLLLVSFGGFCVAEESPGYVVYVQGGEVSITNGTSGNMVVAIQDIIPYCHVQDSGKSYLVPVAGLTNSSLPLNAALVFYRVDGESTSLVRISNLSLSDENKVLTLQVTPLAYYEGSALKTFGTDKNELTGDMAGNNSRTGVYLEMTTSPSTNDDAEDVSFRCFWLCFMSDQWCSMYC